MNKLRYYLVSFLLLLMGPTASFAQQDEVRTGSIAAVVVNAVTQEPLENVNVSVVGTSLGAVTDSLGTCVIAKVPVGNYQVAVSLIGFVGTVVTDVVVGTMKPAVVSVQLFESAIEIGEQSVTADYFAKIPDAPVSTQTQTNEEIRRLPGGFEDVVRAISILPGVARAEPGRNDLIVRGGAPSENLFVVDNLELSNINHFGTQGAGGGPLSFINLDFVQQTGFSSGGFGAKYGDKLSSVMTIDLRNGRRDKIGGKGVISASQFGLNLEGPLGEKGSFLLSARRSYLDFIFKAAKFAFVPEYWDFFARGEFSPGPKDKITFTGIGIVDDVKLFNETSENRYDNSKILYSDQNSGFGGITWKRFFSSGFLTTTLGHSYTEYDYRQNDTLQNPIFKSVSIERETSLRSDVVYQVQKETELSAGVQAKLVGVRSEILLPPFWTNYGQELSVNVRTDTLALRGAVYGQLSEQFGALRATLGIRGEYFSLIENRFAVAPRFSVMYTLSQRATINASTGIYYQSPSLIWLAANEQNRNLKFLRSNHYILGVDYVLRQDTKISLEGYLKRYRDYPVSQKQTYLIMSNTGAGFGGSQESFASFGTDPLVSAGTGLARGIEVFLQKKLSEVPCYGVISVSFNEARFIALDGVERPGSFDQRWILNLGGGYVFSEKWEASMKFRLATGRPYTPFNANGTQDAARYNTERTDANHSLDLRVDRRWFFENWSLVTYIDIQNIYNKKAATVPRFNERTQQTEQPESIGILPSIGVSAEF
jgi:hypothetical protein